MFDAQVVYYLWVVLLLTASAAAWGMTFFMLPGNWMIVALTALFVLLVPVGSSYGIGWLTVAIAVGLAALGELLELVAGAAGAARQGASRRAMLLSMLGTMVGSLVGAFVGVPVPILGPILGALGGGVLGAFAGAYLGETWKGKTPDESLAVGTGALIGRLLGTVGKLAIGGVLIVLIAFDAFF